MRRSSSAVSLGLTAVMAASMTGCSSSPRYTETDSDYGKVCRDTQTEQRVDESKCEHHSPHMGWWFIPLIGGRHIPAVGSSLRGVQGGRSSVPAGTRVGNVGRSGGDIAKRGTVSRGGFGRGGKGGGSGS